MRIAAALCSSSASSLCCWGNTELRPGWSWILMGTVFSAGVPAANKPTEGDTLCLAESWHPHCPHRPAGWPKRAPLAQEGTPCPAVKAAVVVTGLEGWDGCSTLLGEGLGSRLTPHGVHTSWKLCFDPWVDQVSKEVINTLTCFLWNDPAGSTTAGLPAAGGILVARALCRCSISKSWTSTAPLTYTSHR